MTLPAHPRAAATPLTTAAAAAALTTTARLTARTDPS
jgi:hypothetical protein